MRINRNGVHGQIAILFAASLAFSLPFASAFAQVQTRSAGQDGEGTALSASRLELSARSRYETSPGSGSYRIEENLLLWNTRQTAIIICDMWNQHWCKGATERVAEMAPAMNRVIRQARQRGVLIIHAPSDTMAFYKDFPQRRRAQQAPRAQPPSAPEGWQGLNRAQEGPLPIDDSDGGCDCEPRCPSGGPWRSEIAALEIAPEDAISDSGAEVYNLLQQKGIENVILMGVHANMCVLGRSFAIRQMVRWGKRVVLMRDLTDTMYNSRMRPFVSHFRGTDLVVEHIEKYWCPSITSTAFTHPPAFHFPADKRPRIVLVSAEQEYESKHSLPAFAQSELEFRNGFPCTVLQSDATNNLPGLEQLDQADLALFFIRRVTLPPEQLAIVKRYLNSGKPLVALRTSSHAFQNWLAFDGEVLGGRYHGHYPDRGGGLNGFAEPPTFVHVLTEAADHPILKGLPRDEFRVAGTLYQTSPLAAGAIPLLVGRAGDSQSFEPVAWINSRQNARIFYTSMGHPKDFDLEPFRRLLRQAILWSLDLPVPNPNQ